jgi:aryl-alcohol dehydrogenase-like predicted oxidoreductase
VRLHPYPDQLIIITKMGAMRGADASWNPAQSPAELTSAMHGHLRNLGVDVLDVVNHAHHGRRACAERRLDRGAVRRAGGTAAARPDPAPGLE